MPRKVTLPSLELFTGSFSHSHTMILVGSDLLILGFGGFLSQMTVDTVNKGVVFSRHVHVQPRGGLKDGRRRTTVHIHIRDEAAGPKWGTLQEISG